MDEIEAIQKVAAGMPGPSQKSRSSARAALEGRMLAAADGAPSHERTGRRKTLAAPVAALLVVVALSVGAITYAATGVLRVQLPNRPLAHNAVPYLPPLAVSRYTASSPATARPPIAFLGHQPAGLRLTGVWSSGPTGASSSPEADIVARSTVRYRSGNHTVLVTLFEPSTREAGSHVFQLGTRTVRLAGGRLAWASTFPAGIDTDIQPRNRAVHALEYPSGQFIVGIFSDLSQRRVEAIAPYVVVQVG